jgi:hypothetical protein
VSNTEARRIAEIFAELSTGRKEIHAETLSLVGTAYLALEARCAALEGGLKLRPMSEMPQGKYVLCMATSGYIGEVMKTGNDLFAIDGPPHAKLKGWLDPAALAKVLIPAAFTDNGGQG